MSILKNFIKYQSLGNDFILFDWYKKPSSYLHNELGADAWTSTIASLCNRRYGVGADGVLIITTCPEQGAPELLIFNADGSPGDSCLNGLRCVAQYLFVHHHFPEHFTIKMGAMMVECAVRNGGADIITRLCAPQCAGQKSLDSITGHVVTVGNPHFIIMAQQTLSWLEQHGPLLESASVFPNRTNVECAWPSPTQPLLPDVTVSYNMIVYERGCGITLACGSGAAALTGLLHSLGRITYDQKVEICMPGGLVVTWLDAEGYVNVQASAQLVYKGSFDEQ